MMDAIILTPKEIELVLALRERQCLDILYGKITLNFANGELQNVTKEELVFRRLAPRK